MDVNISTRGVIITARQKSYIEKKSQKISRYFKNLNPVSLEIQLIDDSGPNKSGVTQTVKLNLTAPGYELHIEEKKNNLMRAFASAVASMERQVRDKHEQKIKQRKAGGRFDKVLGILKRVRRKK